MNLDYGLAFKPKWFESHEGLPSLNLSMGAAYKRSSFVASEVSKQYVEMLQKIPVGAVISNG